MWGHGGANSVQGSEKLSRSHCSHPPNADASFFQKAQQPACGHTIRMPTYKNREPLTAPSTFTYASAHSAPKGLMIRTLTGRAFVTLALLFSFSFHAGAEDLDIVSISPSTSKPLEAGSEVSFEIVLEYKIESAASRRIQLEILRGGDGERVDTVSRWVQVLPKGKDTLTVKRTVNIPETATIAIEASIPSEEFRVRAHAFQRKEFDVVDRTGKRIKPPATGGDSITLTSLSPPGGSPLQLGESVNFKAKIDYDLRSASSGRILWFFANAGEVQTILVNQVVAAGKGTLDLDKSVQMQFGLGTQPDMLVYLMADGFVRSMAADTERYSMDEPQGNSPNSKPPITVNVADQQLDRVRIVSISPSPEKSLHVGQIVDFEIRLEYELASTDLAELDVRLGNVPRFLGLDDRVIAKGKGSATITRRIVIPQGSAGTLSVRAGFSAPATARDVRRYTIVSQ
jgi:hypothetical protein